MRAMNNLSLLKQHAEDNVHACVANHALFDEIIYTGTDLQQLNRCINETCLWRQRAQESDFLAGKTQKTDTEMLGTGPALHGFEKQFQIV